MGDRTLAVDLPPAYIELCRRIEQEHPKYAYLFDQSGLSESSGHSLATRLGFIQQLGLDKTKPRLRTLDIGAGSGLWSWLVKKRGHRVVSTNPQTDSPTWLDEAYLEAHAALGIPCKPLSVQAFTPIIVNPVDLITSLKTAFHGSWSKSEWEFFLSDLSGCLRNDGRALLQVNYTGHAKSSFAALCSLTLPGGWKRSSYDLFIYNKEEKIG